MTKAGSPSTGSDKSTGPGSSPYATGGGGVTFERRVAAMYLARLLTGGTVVEVGGRRVERVAFQQTPAHRVDDLVVSAVRDDGGEPLQLSVAVRRAPLFRTSDGDTEKLLGDLLVDLPGFRAGGVERRLAICVAGPQRAAQQVAQLAALARSQATAAGFFTLVRTPGRFDQKVVDRLGHLVNLVTANLSTAGLDASPAAADLLTWQLLGHLDVLMPRVETPDETDWIELVNQLQPWARESTLPAATALRDRLESLAAGYAPVAAEVDLTTLRRAAHDVLRSDRRTRATGWLELRRLDSDARAVVGAALGAATDGQGLHLSRPGPSSLLRRELTPGAPVLVTGDSGVGKSALVFGELTDAAVSDPSGLDLVCLNLRLLPPTVAELRGVLGGSVEDLLAEMSAPTRIAVYDGADVVLERNDHLLAHLVRAARSAGVTPWVVSATEGSSAVRAVVEGVAGTVREVAVAGLDDAELEEVARAFPQLQRLADQPRAKELLRRPAVIDLFVRSGSSGLPLSDADAFEIVWTKLVRDDERNTYGLPHARDQVMRHLAAQQLEGLDAATVLASLEPAAVGGLVHDAVLRRAGRWRTLPTFAHDLLRTYAVARVLLSADDPVADLLARDAPRWALPAVRLALQVMLAAPDDAESPRGGRLTGVQDAADRLRDAGHGDRWADLPSEAVLTLPNAGELLADGWSALIAEDAAGLRRLLRVLLQQHGRSLVVDRLVAEPVIALLLDRGWPSALHGQVHELLSVWLRGLVLADEPAGQPLRIVLRDRLVARVAAGDERLAEGHREAAARLAARSPEEVAADEERRKLGPSGSVLGGRRPRREWRELPGELVDETALEQAALLGRDLGEDGAAMLRRVAADAPHHLAPAVEAPLTGRGLASYSTPLLIELIEAFYVDEEGHGGLHDEGIRGHDRGPVTPLAAYYRGPFLHLFRADLRGGVACLNRLLNHAARARVQILRQLRRDRPPELEDDYVTELDITGDRRRYLGDGHVWLWYRGTGVGPYPCMSALQALELVCDEYVAAGVPPAALVPVLLTGCENLAMPGLVVGLLVRHMERAGEALDPFLAEPEVWSLEFSRAVNEYSGLAARTDGIAAPERRQWNLRHVAAQLALGANGDRVDALRSIGERLLARAAELEGLTGQAAGGEELSERMATVHGWAGSLDRRSYTFTKTDEGVLVEQTADPAAAARLAASTADLGRGNDATRILMRYPERFDRHADRRELTEEELLADLALARDLADNPPAAGPLGAYDAPAAVAAAALEATFVTGIDVPDEQLVWPAGLLVNLMNDLADRGAVEDDYAVFGRGADRAAARGLPLLLLPAAAPIRTRLAADGTDADAITRGMSWMVRHGANETRLFLTRALDPLWRTPCTAGGRCYHIEALAVVENTARDCIIGPLDPQLQRNTRAHIDGPVTPALLVAADHDRIFVPQLSATIRGAAGAAVSSACCRDDARALLAAALAAHRRGMRASKYSYQHSANDAATAARAVLDVAATADPSLLFTHLDGYNEQPRQLTEFLRALAAAAEESPSRADAARVIWPSVLDHVIEFVAAGTCPRDHRSHGWDPLAAAIPVPTYDVGYLHREFERSEPILWADPVALTPQIERWLPLAAGDRQPVDALVRLLDRLPAQQQAAVGLPWIERLVLASPDNIANYSYTLPEWLKQVQPHAASPPLRAAWHRIVDALTVAGDDRIAAMAD